ncbi:syntaxin-18-like [Lytechinus variegatus]|uniref:syntaxin-18-like n=1 Tax=Lytechinus variegatus TaxID=7654 RepID=UPI001BB15FC5|nr:syntaxin-18-like [Lytechinus variegatus]
MAADRTSLFKASIKTVRTRNKALGVTKDTSKSSLLSHAKPMKDDFALKAKEVVITISKLKDFLLEHRKQYINAASHLVNDGCHMSDAERDQIDSDAQDFMRTCTDTIRLLKAEAHRQNVPSQVRQHREAVFELIDDYLKGVCKLYSEQRAIRVKRVVDKKRISRLRQEGPSARLNQPVSNKEEEKLKKNPAFDLNLTSPEDEEDDDLSPDEIRMFQQENERLFNDMNCLVDEVRQIEGKVVEIAQLQEIFTDKVLQQSADIDRIGDTVVHTTENITAANQDIREAIKNNAGMRLWILFFLVVCSFSLLFLDWYS